MLIGCLSTLLGIDAFLGHEPSYYTGETEMGSLSHESFEEFLEQLKAAGISITRERELRERLAEAQAWRYAFMTLAAHGRSIGIRFQEPEGGAVDADRVRDTLAEFQFPEHSQQVLAASLKSWH